MFTLQEWKRRLCHGFAVWFTIQYGSVHLHYVIVWSTNMFPYVTKWSMCCHFFPVVFGEVHPGLDLNHMQYLGVEEMRNGLDKPSAERNLMKR